MSCTGLHVHVLGGDRCTICNIFVKFSIRVYTRDCAPAEHVHWILSTVLINSLDIGVSGIWLETFCS